MLETIKTKTRDFQVILISLLSIMAFIYIPFQLGKLGFWFEGTVIDFLVISSYFKTWLYGWVTGFAITIIGIVFLLICSGIIFFVSEKIKG